jgi:DNA-binding response OmpR family regulator
MKLLVVEDHVRIAGMLRKGLIAGGFSVDCAATGGEALERTANGTSYDLIILDLGLPDVDGLNVLELLRARGLTVPVIVLTARTGDRERALALGANAYFVKPLPFPELLEQVDRQLATR